MSKVKVFECEGFSQFWETWRPHMRHTDGRGAARDAFGKHILNGADPQDMIDGATGFFRFMAEKDKPYVPLASSWLNREAYPDWAEREREFQRRSAELEATKSQNVVQIRQAPKTAFLQDWEKRRQEG